MFNGFSSSWMFPSISYENFGVGICSCCGASAICENTNNLSQTRSILIGSNLPETKMAKSTATPYNSGRTYFKVEVPNGDIVSLYLQLAPEGAE